MTDEEMGRKLAEACGFAYQGEWYYTGWDDLTGGATHSLVVDLATSVDAIVKHVFPVLDKRFGAGKWEVETATRTDRSDVMLWIPAPRPRWQDGIKPFEVKHESLARALAEVCLAALTEVTA